jgi:hypothetical protein
MQKIATAALLATLVGASIPLSANSAVAAPLSAARLTVPGESLSDVIQVRWRGRRAGAAFAGAAIGIIGAIIASQARPRYYYDYGAYYYGPPVYYVPPPLYDPAVAYCMRRFRSYDPYSGTYLGYDGYRHPCP